MKTSIALLLLIAASCGPVVYVVVVPEEKPKSEGIAYLPYSPLPYYEPIDIVEHDTNCSGGHIYCSVYHLDGRSCVTCIPGMAIPDDDLVIRKGWRDIDMRAKAQEAAKKTDEEISMELAPPHIDSLLDSLTGFYFISPYPYGEGTTTLEIKP